MNTPQDPRRVSAEEWANLYQTSGRRAHVLRREMFEGVWRACVASIRRMASHLRVQKSADNKFYA